MSTSMTSASRPDNSVGTQRTKSGNYMARVTKRWNDVQVLARKRDLSTDAVHEPVTDSASYISPAQPYSTDSGSLFNAGKFLIAMVGLPATSKTLLSVAITRYARWSGVRIESFHITKYEAIVAGDGESHNDMESEGDITLNGDGAFRERVLKAVTDDMTRFFRDSKGQIAIYDALNIRRRDRAFLQDKFSKYDIKVVFIESIVTDPVLLKENIEIATKSKDYEGWDRQKAIANYKRKITAKESLYQTIEATENVCYIKYINSGRDIIINNNNYGYLVNKIVFFLMNLKHKRGCVYFARCGRSDRDRYTDDEVLNEEGLRYSKLLTDIVINRIKHNNRKARGQSESQDEGSNEDGTDFDPQSLVVWAAPRKRTYDSGLFFQEQGVELRKRSQLKQMHPGVVADMTDEEIKEKYPEEYQEYLKDPYHYRFTRAESYHDLAIRMEPLLLEIEHMSQNILIIAHDSTLRVLYGYFMACTSSEVPYLEFTREFLTEISFSPFCNTVERIPITQQTLDEYLK